MENLFVGLGFMKCATTFLTQRLTRHPDIYMPPIRELRYWTAHFEGRPLPRQGKYASRAMEQIAQALESNKPFDGPLEKLNYWHLYAHTKPTGLDAYERLFSPRAGQAAAGEITPTYVELGRDQLARLGEMLPDARFFVTLRHPYKRLVSHYNHETRLRPGEVKNDRATRKWLEIPRIAAQIEYGTFLENAYAALGRERVRVFYFEDMVADPRGYFTRLLDYIGVPFDPEVLPPPSESRSESKKREMSAELVASFRERVAHVPAQVEALVGEIPAGWKAG